MASKHKQPPTGNPLEKARQALSTVNPEMINDVSVTSLQGGMTITVIFRSVTNQKAGKEEKQKWAKIAKRLSDADLLRDGLGEKVRRNIKGFRDNFAM